MLDIGYSSRPAAKSDRLGPTCRGAIDPEVDGCVAREASCGRPAPKLQQVTVPIRDGLGWSRQQAIDYMVDNSPNTIFSCEEEVDRYIGMPGQALSYMLGRLEIQRMRREAEASLGDRFDIKAFHDTFLGSGIVPLGTLDRMVSDWAAV